MFDTVDSSSPEGCGPPLDAAVLAGWAHDLAEVDRLTDDSDRIDAIRALEVLKAAAAAAQADLARAFDISQRGAQAGSGVAPSQQGRGVANQIALARRESPHRGRQHLGLAKALVGEMPFTLAALRSGHLNEWRATLLVRETACLTLEDRRSIDRALAADTDTLDELGDGQLVAEVRKLAYQMDPRSVVDRARRAESERRVTTRPAPDTMAYVTALLPVAQAVAVHAALSRAADSTTSAGDPRSRGQIMADTLVERVTGQARAADVPVQVNLVMSLEALLGGADDTAHLDGCGPVPAGLARDIVDSATTAERAWLRRLFRRPSASDLVTMDSRQRRFPDGLATLIKLRDQRCRTPWCDAPIRHIDHVVAYDAGGATSGDNAQGLCEQCNHAKQAPGWQARPRPGPDFPVETATPTGHRYRSTAPAPPGAGADRPRSLLEARFEELVLAS